MAQDADLVNNGIFVGTQAEHADYVRVTGVDIPYHPVNDFLELANIVAGAELVVANQNFVYSLAMGLGRPAILETIKIKPLQMNECYFPRTNCQYF
jgi:molybdopterin-guanine dinucleotide biosynthesis protein A